MVTVSQSTETLTSLIDRIDAALSPTGHFEVVPLDDDAPAAFHGKSLQSSPRRCCKGAHPMAVRRAVRRSTRSCYHPPSPAQ